MFYQDEKNTLFAFVSFEINVKKHVKKQMKKFVKSLAPILDPSGGSLGLV